MPTQYWLMKSEPGSYSIDNLKGDGKTGWSGVRNYQARNYMRDGMRVGDLVLFYHSSGTPGSENPTGVAGIAKISGAAKPDLSALDKKDDHYDPKSTKDEPIWLMVEVAFVEKFAKTVTLETLRATKGLEQMQVLKRGRRLSIQPVTPGEFEIVRGLAK